MGIFGGTSFIFTEVSARTHPTMSSCLACNNAVGVATAAGGESSKVLRCGRCLLAVYCSKQCQRRHWKTHKEQCFTKEERKLRKKIARQTTVKDCYGQRVNLFETKIKNTKKKQPKATIN